MSFQGGNIVENDDEVGLHVDEVVLPADVHTGEVGFLSDDLGLHEDSVGRNADDAGSRAKKTKCKKPSVGCNTFDKINYFG